MKDINEKGQLMLGGVSAEALAKEYGTPLYVLERDVILEKCRSFKKAIDKRYKGLVVYASKAMNCLEMCRIMKEEGLGIDVVSIGELYTAIKAGVDTKNVVFHGSNKSEKELEMAIENNIGRIVIDNIEELKRIEEIAIRLDKKVNVMPRLKPGIDVHTHDYIKTGQIDSKFGFSIENGEADEIVKEIIKYSALNLVGFHCHIGSQIFEIEPFADAAEIMLNFMNKIEKTFNIKLKDLNLGGGFGIIYTKEDDPPAYEDFIEAVHERIENVCKDLNMEIPFILIEPGRAIVGEAGTTLYKVGVIKEIENVRTYVGIDGGITDNPRYALYQAKYEIANANKMNNPKNKIITLAGKCCESGDLIGENMEIQDIEVGDIISVFSTGAYNYSMSSNYNRIPKIPVVMVSGGKSKVIVRGETLEDVCKYDV